MEVTAPACAGGCGGTVGGSAEMVTLPSGFDSLEEKGKCGKIKTEPPARFGGELQDGDAERAAR